MTTLLKKSTTKFMMTGGSQFQLVTCFPQISHTLPYETVAERLHYHEICARWVPKMLMDEQKKKQHMTLSVTFLLQYNNLGRNSWITLWLVKRPGLLTATLKWENNPWFGSIVVRQNQICKQTFRGRKLIATVFWGRKGVLLVAFMNPGATDMLEVYCETLQWLRRAIQNRWHGLLSSDFVLLHDNV